MSSGIQASEECVAEFDNMRNGPISGRPSYMLFKLNEDNTKIVLDYKGDKDETYEDCKQKLLGIGKNPEGAEGRYAVIDFPIPNATSKLILIKWCPENLHIKKKMTMSSSFNALKIRLNGFKVAIECNDDDDLEVANILDKIPNKN